MKSRDHESNFPAARPKSGRFGGNGRYALSLVAVVLSLVCVLVILDGRKSKKPSLDAEFVSPAIQISSSGAPALRNVLQRYTIATPQELELPDRPAHDVAFGPAGNVLYVSAGKNVTAVAYPTLEFKFGFMCHADDIDGLAVDDVGARLATAAADHTACVWSLDDWSKVEMNLSAFDRDRKLPSPTGTSRLSKFDSHDGVICCVAFSSSTNVAATCSTDSTIALWNSDNGVQIHEFDAHKGAVLTLDFSRSGRWLATAGSDSTIRVWDVSSGELAYELRGHVGYVNQVKFAGDEIVVSGGDDNTARIWSLEGDSYRSLVATHPDHVDAIAIDYRYDRALSLCADGLIQLHSLKEFRTTGEVKLRVSYARRRVLQPLWVVCGNLQ